MRLATFLGGPGSKYLHMPSGWIQDQKTEIFVSATTHIAGYYEKICSHHIVPHILPPWKKTNAQAWRDEERGETPRHARAWKVMLKPPRRRSVREISNSCCCNSTLKHVTRKYICCVTTLCSSPEEEQGSVTFYAQSLSLKSSQQQPLPRGEAFLKFSFLQLFRGTCSTPAPAVCDHDDMLLLCTDDATTLYRS